MGIASIYMHDDIKPRVRFMQKDSWVILLISDDLSPHLKDAELKKAMALETSDLYFIGKFS